MRNKSLFCDFVPTFNSVALKVWVVEGYSAADSFLRDAGWESGGTPEESHQSGHSLTSRSGAIVENKKYRLEPKIDLRKGSEAGQSRR